MCECVSVGVSVDVCCVCVLCCVQVRRPNNVFVVLGGFFGEKLFHCRAVLHLGLCSKQLVNAVLLINQCVVNEQHKI